jgi:hypothetical protein
MNQTSQKSRPINLGPTCGDSHNLETKSLFWVLLIEFAIGGSAAFLLARAGLGLMAQLVALQQLP